MSNADVLEKIVRFGLGALMLLTAGCTDSMLPRAQLAAPENGAEVRLMDPAWKEILKTRLASEKDEHPDNLAFPRPVTLKWENAQRVAVQVEIARDETFADGGTDAFRRMRHAGHQGRQLRPRAL